MGSMLPKPVESVVIERHVGKSFRVGIAEVNGWRNSMEDAHLIHMSDDWGFFGVFDGHGGDQCSGFVADRISKTLVMTGCPSDDAAVKQLCLGVDQEFLDRQQDSGSTGTMCIVHVPTGGANKFRLRLANVGDSRVLLGRRSGSIVAGGGTDQGLTTDHKPENPSERERIYRCGGHVEKGDMGGPERVNGELSVSRCFGDARFKVTGGPGPENHPVTANPELGSAECDAADFLLLVCDGVSEGDFPNAEVVKMVAANLKSTDDPGEAARAVCLQSIVAGSKDNVTCMVVLLSGSGTLQKSKEFIPGQLNSESLTNKGFMTAYEAMAKRASMTLAQAGEMRYEAVCEALASNGLGPVRARELRAEKDAIGSPTGSKGSSKRNAWFRNWESRLPESFTADDSEADMIRLLMARQGLAGGGPPTAASMSGGRRVRIPDLTSLKKSVSESPALEWDGRMSQLAGAEGQVGEDDPADGTSRVWCPDCNMTAWLPTAVLVDLDEGSAKGQARTSGGGTPASAQKPPRLEQRPGSGVNGTNGAGARRAPRPEASQVGIRGGSPSTAGARGSSPSSTPTAAGARGASPSSSYLSQNGARSFAAARLPSLASTGGLAVGGNRTASPSAAHSLGYTMPSPGSGFSAAAIRNGTGRRAPSPIDFAGGNRTRGEAAPGRMSRSQPPPRQNNIW